MLKLQTRWLKTTWTLAAPNQEGITQLPGEGCETRVTNSWPLSQEQSVGSFVWRVRTFELLLLGFCGVSRFRNRCLQTQVLFACKQKHCPWALSLACAANMPNIESQQIVPDDPRDCMELRLKATVCTSTYRTPSASSVQTCISMWEVWITSWYLHTDASSHEQGEVWRVANYLHPSLQAFIWPSSPSLVDMLERCSVVSRRAETFI